MTDKVLSNFVDKHLGKRIFIFGTGPGLNDVTPEQLAHIEENEISIGVNFTPFHVTPTYWVAGGHATYTAFAIEHLSDKTTGIFHHDPGARRADVAALRLQARLQAPLRLHASAREVHH